MDPGAADPTAGRDLTALSQTPGGDRRRANSGGLRGSLAKGVKGPHKVWQPFDPTSFDIDAFIVSNRLAERFKGIRARWGSQLEEIRSIEKEINRILREMPEFSGLRKNGFSFRIYTTEEARKFLEAIYFLIWREQ
jgi:filamentous hemagglutinin